LDNQPWKKTRISARLSEGTFRLLVDMTSVPHMAKSRRQLYMNSTFSKGSFSSGIAGNSPSQQPAAEALICLRGRCTLQVTDGKKSEDVELAGPMDALVMERGVSYAAKTSPQTIILSIISET